jgi:hypothetical protein
MKALMKKEGLIQNAGGRMGMKAAAANASALLSAQIPVIEEGKMEIANPIAAVRRITIVTTEAPTNEKTVQTSQSAAVLLIVMKEATEAASAKTASMAESAVKADFVKKAPSAMIAEKVASEENVQKTVTAEKVASEESVQKVMIAEKGASEKNAPSVMTVAREAILRNVHPATSANPMATSLPAPEEEVLTVIAPPIVNQVVKEATEPMP